MEKFQVSEYSLFGGLEPFQGNPNDPVKVNVSSKHKFSSASCIWLDIGQREMKAENLKSQMTDLIFG